MTWQESCVIKPWRLALVGAVLLGGAGSLLMVANADDPMPVYVIRPSTKPATASATSLPATTRAATAAASAPATPAMAGPALTRKTTDLLKLPAELPSATGYGVEDAFPNDINFREPVSLATIPNDTDKLFVVEKQGKIFAITGLNSKAYKKFEVFDINDYLKVTGIGQLNTRNEWGLLGLAFHPNFAANGYVYIFYSFNAKDDNRQSDFNRLARFTLAKSTGKFDYKSEMPLITQYDRAENHNGGDVKFGPDGYLYFSTGDEGNQGDNFDNSRFIDKNFFGGIFRIDVDKKATNLEPNATPQNSKIYPSPVHAGTYKVPADNPFVKTTEYDGRKLDPKRVRTEMFALGFRNAWRMSFDSATGRLFVGDVGDGGLEEFDIVQPGGNYGWSYKEGTRGGPRGGGGNAKVKLIDPIWEYGHGGGEFFGASSIGGVVYHGTKMPELDGAYICGDYVSRRVFMLQMINNKWTPKNVAENVGGVSCFGADPTNGDVLICDLGGKIKRMVRKGMNGPQPPALLSQTGAFTNTITLTPSAALIPYAPNVSFWSDGAIKQRWFAIPKADDKITFNKDGNWEFPEGMVWVKHFEMEFRKGDSTSKRRLETRFLVKTRDGVYGLTYKWKANQQDAELVPENGFTETIPMGPAVAGAATQPASKTWRYPSRSECIVCHTPIAGGALAFNTPQLNTTGNYGGKLINLIQGMSDAGYFTEKTPDPKTLGAFYRADDKTKPLEHRVRSYLAVNCVQCHQQGSIASGTWDARPTLSLDQANIVGGNLIADHGDPLNKIIVPGDPAHSMMLKRISTRGPGQMPPLATNEVDQQAVDLLNEWIKSLPKK
jgi:glucose/arabinose dehydrogenase